jgi:integrase
MASATRSGGAWKIRFYDGSGTRRQIHLAGVNQRTAENIARHVGVLNAARIANDANIDRGTALWLSGCGESLHAKLAAVGLVEEREAGTLGGFLEAYLKDRPDAKNSTRLKWRSAVVHLEAHFGSGRDLRKISKGDADAFRASLYRKGHAENTVRRYCGIAKQFFRAAQRRRLIDENPFSDQVAAVKGNAAKFHFVTKADAAKILRACPDVQWRMIFALARFGGLRCPSEILALNWEDISWNENRFTARSPKTEHHQGKECRVIPLFPELRVELNAGFEEAVAARDAAGGRGAVSGPVITRYRDSTQNLRTTFLKILKRAGLKPWPKLMQNLRSTRETELAESFPLQAVTAWMGNSLSVAARHYLQVRDEHFERAAAGSTEETDPQTDPKAAENGVLPPNPKRTTREKHRVFRGSSVVFSGMRENLMGDEGLEPPRENTGKTAVSEGDGPTDGPKTQRTDLDAIKAALAALPPERLAEVLAAAIQSGAGMR